jgi:hypothetical protein
MREAGGFAKSHASAPPIRALYHGLLIMTEAVSAAGAIGMAQFKPETATEMGINRQDPAQALEGAVHLVSRPHTGDPVQCAAVCTATHV